MHAYKIQLTQDLKPTDHVQCREFGSWVLENQKVDGNFSKKIIFSDEGHFQLDGCVNTQNCQIWGVENPWVIHEKPWHAQRATVWWGFWAGGVIGPYFLENEARNAVTVNGVHYHNMIMEFCGLNWTVCIWKTCGSSRTVQPLTLHVKQLSCCEKNFLALSSHSMAIRIGHRGRVIWHRVNSFFGGLWSLVSMPTNYIQILSSRWRFDVPLAKLSRNYAEMSSRILSKEQECASGVVGNICQILCSIINHSVCTLCLNKNISTFWINGAFYCKIKSWALVGTPFICH